MADSPTVSLRGQRSDDWDNLFTLLSHEEVLYLTDELPYLSDDAFRERYMNSAEGVHRLIGEISFPSGRTRLVGMACLTQRQRRRRHAGVLQLFVHPDHFTTDEERTFLSGIIRFADDWLGLHRLEWVLYADSARMIALAEQHGFSCEATLQQYAFRSGSYHDACLMARLRGPHRAQNPTDAETGASPRAQHTIEPQDVVVRGCEIDDWEDVAEILNSGNVAASTLQLPYTSRDVSRERLENVPDTLRLLVAEIDGQVVGQLGIHFQTGRRAHSAALGMMVHADYQGQGIGNALMKAAVELCESWLNIRRMALEVYTDNASGVALYSKFGFEIEGILRDQAFRAGQYVDAYMMARIRAEDD